MSDGMFTNLNPLGEALDYVEGKSLEELRVRIKAIRLPTRIISIYSFGNRHVAWIITEAKIKKVRKAD